MVATGSVFYPVELGEVHCDALSDLVVGGVEAAATNRSASILEVSDPDCSGSYVKQCFTFASDEDAVKMEDWFNLQTGFWFEWFAGTPCAAWLSGYDVSVSVGGDGDPFNVPYTCIDVEPARAACTEKLPEYPKCECVTRKGITRFGALPVITEYPGRKNYTKLYCFNITVVNPLNPNAGCGRTTTLRSAEIFADDAQRARVKAIGVRAGGNANFTYFFESWGAVGDQTLKTPMLNWSEDQARGGQICMEVEHITVLDSFCVVGGSTCWINLFDESKNCCPLFPATLI